MSSWTKHTETEAKNDQIWFQAPYPALLLRIELSHKAALRGITLTGHPAVRLHGAKGDAIDFKEPPLLLPGRRLTVHFVENFQGTVFLVAASPQRGIFPELSPEGRLVLG